MRLKTNKIGIEKFKKFLENIDPEYIYQNNDVQRLLRSYNVYFSTGKTLTEWHKMPNLGSVNRKIFSILLYVLLILVLNISFFVCNEVSIFDILSTNSIMPNLM